MAAPLVAVTLTRTDSDVPHGIRRMLRGASARQAPLGIARGHGLSIRPAPRRRRWSTWPGRVHGGVADCSPVASVPAHAPRFGSAAGSWAGTGARAGPARIAAVGNDVFATRSASTAPARARRSACSAPMVGGAIRGVLLCGCRVDAVVCRGDGQPV
jgi:hypothetical protein